MTRWKALLEALAGLASGERPRALFDRLRAPAERSAARRTLVRKTHPDRMVARGMPEEAEKRTETLLIVVNRAWESLDAGTP